MLAYCLNCDNYQIHSWRGWEEEAHMDQHDSLNCKHSEEQIDYIYYYL